MRRPTEAVPAALGAVLSEHRVSMKEVWTKTTVVLLATSPILSGAVYYHINDHADQGLLRLSLWVAAVTVAVWGAWEVHRAAVARVWVAEGGIFVRFYGAGVSMPWSDVRAVRVEAVPQYGTMTLVFETSKGVQRLPNGLDNMQGVASACRRRGLIGEEALPRVWRAAVGDGERLPP